MGIYNFIVHSGLRFLIMISTNIYKWVFLICCAIMTMLFGLAPIKIAGCKKNDKILGIANSFSGGVFLAIAFVHILPETSDIYYDAKLQSLIDSKRDKNH